MTELPERTRDYIGPVTATRKWDQFDLRPGDIILSTPPKSGTTWSQAILMMLLEGAAVTDRAIWRESIWLDCGFRDQQSLKAALDAEIRRRCIKSHTPFGAMKETARQRLDGIDDGAFLQASTFFDSATNNKWKGHLSDAELASYQTRFSALATPEEIDWLENGSGAA